MYNKSQNLFDIEKNEVMAFIKKYLQSQNWRVILVMVIATGLLCSPVYYHRIAVPVDTDYGSHVLYTQQMLEGKGLDPLNLSHPVLELILAAMHLATGRILGVYASLMVLQVLVQILTVLIIYFWIGEADRKYWDWVRMVVAITITFVAPVMFLAIWDGEYYYGYIGLANYHNPTIHLLKPFALLSFMCASKAVAGKRSSWGYIALAAFWMVLCAWIKPNYTLAILPALVVVVPFLVEGTYSHNLLIKFFLSALFPLVVLVIARRFLLKDSNLLLGWVGFLSGAAQFYLLAEGGERMLHANFRWSGQIMLFLLFVVAARWLLREKILPNKLTLPEKFFSYGAYLLQLAGGIAYYVHVMISVHYW
jgi:hypothetical protein